MEDLTKNSKFPSYPNPESIGVTDDLHADIHRWVPVNRYSTPVDLKLYSVIPVLTLYYGTTERFIPDIKEKGILPMSQQYVHLSPDFATALKVGDRNGKPVVLRVDSALMHRAGYNFYLSENYVWLVEKVPVEYISFPE